MADDDSGVPVEHLNYLDIRMHAWLIFVLFCLLTIMAVTLVQKGVVTWHDFLPARV